MTLTTTADAPAELATILRPEVNLCLWQREVPVDLVRFVDTSLAGRDYRRCTTWDGNEPEWLELGADLAAADGFEAFRDDVTLLAHVYAELTGAARLAIKLEAFAGNLCERFHVDRVGLRLICSYAGPGTEWLANADVDRRSLQPDAAAGPVRPGGQVRQMPRWAVGLMKGERWPGNTGNGLVHRSPKCGPTERRVLLKIEQE